MVDPVNTGTPLTKSPFVKLPLPYIVKVLPEITKKSPWLGSPNTVLSTKVLIPLMIWLPVVNTTWPLNEFISDLVA